jgi:hypothetical protein
MARKTHITLDGDKKSGNVMMGQVSTGSYGYGNVAWIELLPYSSRLNPEE